MKQNVHNCLYFLIYVVTICEEERNSILEFNFL